MLKRILVFLFFSTFLVNAYSQKSLLEKKISLTVENESVVSALEKVEHLAGLYFSFNGSLFNKDKKISFHASNKKIIEILCLIIEDKTLVYREHSDQIIIYRPKQGDTEGIAIHHQPKIAKENQKIYPIYDTIVDYKIKTFVDTLRVFDSVTVYDTLKIYKTIETPSIGNEKSNQYWNVSLSAGTTFSSIQYKAIQHEQESTIAILKNSNKGGISPQIGFGISYGNKLRINTGLGFLLERENQNIQTSFDEIKFSHIHYDTITTSKLVTPYYEYLNGDTIWHTIYDTTRTITPINRYDTLKHTLNHQKANICLNLTVPFYASYQFVKLHNIEIGFNLGLITHILIYCKGNYLNTNNGQLELLSKRENNKINVNVYSAPTFSYTIHSNYVCKIEPYYIYGLQSTFTNATGISRMVNYLGFSVSLLKKL